MSSAQVSKPRAANQSITEESGRPGTVRSKVGCPAIEEPCTNRMVPFVAWPEGGAFCHRKSLTSPFFVQCSTPLMRVLVSMALWSSGESRDVLYPHFMQESPAPEEEEAPCQSERWTR